MKYIFIVFVGKNIGKCLQRKCNDINKSKEGLTFCSKVVISCSAFESLNLYSLICLFASP